MTQVDDVYDCLTYKALLSSRRPASNPFATPISSAPPGISSPSSTGARTRPRLTLILSTALLCLPAGMQACSPSASDRLDQTLARLRETLTSGYESSSELVLQVRKGGDQWTLETIERASRPDMRSPWSSAGRILEGGGLKDGSWDPDNTYRITVNGRSDVLQSIAASWFVGLLRPPSHDAPHLRAHHLEDLRQYFQARKGLLIWNPALAVWDIDWKRLQTPASGATPPPDLQRLRGLAGILSNPTLRNKALSIIDGALVPALAAPTLYAAQEELGRRIQALSFFALEGEVIAHLVPGIPQELVYDFVRHSVSFNPRAASALTSHLENLQVFLGVERGLLEATAVPIELPPSWLSGSADTDNPRVLERALSLLRGLTYTPRTNEESCAQVDCSTDTKRLRGCYREARAEFGACEWRLSGNPKRPVPVKSVNPK